MIQLRPLFDQIVVRPIEKDQLRKSGVMIPDTARGHHPPYEGIVVACGPGLDWWESHGVEMPVKVGDHIMYPWNHGMPIVVEEEELIVLRVSAVTGVMEEVPSALGPGSEPYSMDGAFDGPEA